MGHQYPGAWQDPASAITRRSLVAGGAALLGVGVGVAKGTPAAAATAIPHEVLAFYYGWYGTPQTSGAWRHWAFDQNHHLSNVTNTPLGGPYDSLDPADVRAQVVLARQSGVTGFIASWWGQHGFEDASLSPLLEAAQAEGLKVSAYLEKLPGADEAARAEMAIDDLLYILRVHASHPAWLRVHGKPVIFLYGRVSSVLTLPTWRSVLDRVRRGAPAGLVAIGPAHADAMTVFDGGHDYSVVAEINGMAPQQARAWAAGHYGQIVANAGQKVVCATVIPGYDDSHLGRSLPRPTADRAGSETYADLWDAAISSRPDWVLVTSWNEWHEGTEIAPSRQDGDRYAIETKRLAARFMATPLRTP